MSAKRIIRTVTGDIPEEDLGVCYPHEHLFGQPPSHASKPDFILDDPEAALKELEAFRRAGGRALVDMSTLDYNRDVRALKDVSMQSGIHIIAATGFNKDTFSKEIIDGLSDEAMYDLFYYDVMQGIEGTGIRAGVLKASSMLNAISESARRVFETVSAVHLQTGVPISTHTQAGTMALEQVTLFQKYGVDPRSVIIGHLDRKLEEAYLHEVASTGVFLGFDQISKEKYYSDSARIKMIHSLIDGGYEDQILLSGDLARRSYWPSYGAFGGPGLTYILWRFVPWLRESGVEDRILHKFIGSNPARALSFVPGV